MICDTDVIEKEIQEEKKRMEAAEALEEEDFRKEMTRRNLEPGRVDTIRTMADVPNGDNIV